METAADPAQAILDRIAEREVARARLEPETAEDMLQFQDLRRRQAESAPNATVRELEESFAADELALVLLLPTRVVQCQLAQARRVRGRLPLTWLASREGRIDAYRVSLIASAVDKLTDNHAVIELDHRVAAYASSHTASQTNAWLKRFVARNAPSDQITRIERAKRGVWVDHQDDGMSFLHAYIPTTDAVRIDQLINAQAKDGMADGRTLEQRRADAFVQEFLADGHGPISSRAVIGITVPVTSLAGLSDEPGVSFDGAFALPAAMVRDLAVQPGTLFHRVMTDPLGQILDIAELGRFPSSRLRTAVEIRDGTCRFATCSRPAMQSDLDHEIPHPRGPTSGDNLAALCRRHHRMKTFGVTDPRASVVHPRTRSRMERDLAHWLVGLDYAA